MRSRIDSISDVIAILECLLYWAIDVEGMSSTENRWWGFLEVTDFSIRINQSCPKLLNVYIE